MRKTKHVIGPAHIVVGFLALFQVGGLDAGLVIGKEEGRALEDQVLAVRGLPFDSVVNVGEANVHVDDWIGGVERVCPKEVVWVGVLATLHAY